MAGAQERLIGATRQYADALMEIGLCELPRIAVRDSDSWATLLHAAPSWSTKIIGGEVTIMIDGIEYLTGGTNVSCLAEEVRDAIRAELEEYFSCPNVSGVELSQHEVDYIIGGIARRLAKGPHRCAG